MICMALAAFVGDYGYSQGFPVHWFVLNRYPRSLGPRMPHMHHAPSEDTQDFTRVLHSAFAT